MAGGDYGAPLEVGKSPIVPIKSWLSAVAIITISTALYTIDTARTAIIGFHNTSTLHSIAVYIVGLLVLLLLLNLISTGASEWRGGGVSGILNHDQMLLGKNQINNSIDSYKDNFGKSSRAGDGGHDELLKKRQSNYMQMVNHFYDLVTDFYEYGWGDCFHFGFRFEGEGFMESIRRTEYFLASRLGLKAGIHAVDIGCGVGGPMRNIARFSGAKITGINNNSYQIKVGTKHNQRWALDQQCDFLQSDFMNIQVPDNTFDAGYAIEATCHAPDKVGVYGEAFRVIKPGGYFAAYDWCVTPKYDSNNKEHVSIREGIEVGNGLPVLATEQECVNALKSAGFEVIEYFNAQQDAHKGVQHVPWYKTLEGEYSLTGFRMTPIGRFFTHLFVSALEFIHIAPKGSVKVSKLLNDTAYDLVAGGRLEIFTPSFYFLARKPLNANGKARK